MRKVADVTGKDLEKLEDNESLANVITYDNRIVYMVCVKTVVAGSAAWLYIGVDSAVRDEARKRLTLGGLEAVMSYDEIDKRVRRSGGLRTTRDGEDGSYRGASTYHDRRHINQVFYAAKSNADFLPSVDDELAQGSRLLLTFVATAMHQFLQHDLIAMGKSKTDVSAILAALRNR